MFTPFRREPTARRSTAIIISTFLGTFLIARLIVYAIMAEILPDSLFLHVKGVHIHHFSYGVALLVIVGWYLILRRPKPESRSFFLATWFYGVGLGLTFDEFGMWIMLDDNYWIRQSYDAIVVITLLLLNFAYGKTVLKWLHYFWNSILGFNRKQEEEND